MIKFLDLQKVNARYAEELHEATRRVIDRGWYLQGEECGRFEEEYARYIGTRCCVSCASGLDALILMLRAYMELGRIAPGDEVIVPANTYIATILAISENGLTPVLVEPKIDTLQIDDARIEEAITPRTRAILLVHLYGTCSYTERIGELARKYGLLVLEDNAQGHGSVFSEEVGVRSEELGVRSSQPIERAFLCSWREDEALAECSKSEECFLRRTGALGHAAAHSFYPGKNLGALGDGGAVTTDDAEVAEVIRALANYGSQKKYVFKYKGRNSRLDEMQAAILSVKLRHLDEDNLRRKEIARYYEETLNPGLVPYPTEKEGFSSVYHIFPILSPHRDSLQQYLASHGIQTLIHYPIPPHKQECYPELHHLSLPVTEQISAQELSLPMSPVLTDAEVEEVVKVVNSFHP